MRAGVREFWGPADKVIKSTIHIHARIAHLENLLRDAAVRGDDLPGHRVELGALKKATGS